MSSTLSQVPCIRRLAALLGGEARGFAAAAPVNRSDSRSTLAESSTIYKLQVESVAERVGAISGH